MSRHYCSLSYCGIAQVRQPRFLTMLKVYFKQILWSAWEHAKCSVVLHILKSTLCYWWNRLLMMKQVCSVYFKSKYTQVLVILLFGLWLAHDVSKQPGLYFTMSAAANACDLLTGAAPSIPENSGPHHQLCHARGQVSFGRLLFTKLLLLPPFPLPISLLSRKLATLLPCHAMQEAAWLGLLLFFVYYSLFHPPPLLFQKTLSPINNFNCHARGQFFPFFSLQFWSVCIFWVVVIQ